jgi:photoactive yellow protein
MPNEHATRTDIDFDAPHLQALLDGLRDDPSRYDALDFGLIAMDLDGTIVFYNRVEAQFAGLSPNRVRGLVFFTDVAPCTNNYLVAGRYEDEAIVDETIDYVFTVKMRPTPVRLRLLKDEGTERQYLAVKW